MWTIIGCGVLAYLLIQVIPLLLAGRENLR